MLLAKKGFENKHLYFASDFGQCFIKMYTPIVTNIYCTMHITDFTSLSSHKELLECVQQHPKCVQPSSEV